MRASTSFILTIALGTVFFYFLNRPYVPGPPCPDRTPEFLERAVTQRMESSGTRFFNPDKLAVAFLAQHRFLQDEIQYSPSSRLWGIAFTVGEGQSTSKNSWTAIVGCAGSVELSGWEPKPTQTGWRPPKDWIPPDQR